MSDSTLLQTAVALNECENNAYIETYAFYEMLANQSLVYRCGMFFGKFAATGPPSGLNLARKIDGQASYLRGHSYYGCN